MDFLDKNIEEYAINHTTNESENLNKLNRETWLNKTVPRMLSGHLQGTLLSMVSQMIKPKRILEIGTYTGYSAIAMFKGLDKNGLLYTIDINEEHKSLATKYFKKEKAENNIKMLIGDAINIIPTLEEKWDLVFIDADKINYSNYYDLIIDKVRKGGWIIADNVLWSGKVLSEIEEKDIDTEALIKFNDKIQADNRVENMLLPFRDGLMIIRKK